MRRLDDTAERAARVDDPPVAAFDDVAGPRVRAVKSEPVEAGESLDDLQRLLDDSWTEEQEPFTRRQRAAGATISVGFLIVALQLVLFAPIQAASGPAWLIAALAVAFALASRVEFPIGAGYAVPTQLFLPPLFILAPAPAVPLIVLGAHSAAALAGVLTGRSRADRVVDVGTDSWHTIAPALVVILAQPSAGSVPLWLPLTALMAQMLSEVAVSTLRMWLGDGVPPQLQLRVLLNVWGIDLALTPVAVGCAFAALAEPSLLTLPLAPLGFVALLALVTRDRTLRIQQSHDRLEALRVERTRLEVAVQRIGDAFASKLDLDALLNITMRAAVEALGAEGARASAHHGAGRRLVRRATFHEDPALEPALVAAEQAAGLTGELSTATVNDVVALACPLRAEGDGPMAGVITLARRDGTFAANKHEQLKYLCEQAGHAATDIERHTMLHRQALTDELTGLANHRRLQEVLALGADAFALSGAPLAFVLFDLDNFKQVNDTRGHQTGDHVLRAVSEVLRGCCRAGDEAARYGGEELAIILHATELPAALAVAERARAQIAALELVDTEGRDLQITTSVGVASLGPGIRDPQALIAAADAALYEAKHAGKNRVHFQSGTGSV